MNSDFHIGSELTETQIQENYDRFIEFLKQNFSGARLEGLLKMYSEDELGLSLATAPASSKIQFHHAWQGGYLQHVMHVEMVSRGVRKLYSTIGGLCNFTDEERVFAALHHDLGKLGDENGPLYIRNDSDWHVKNRGEIYKFNPDLQHMRVTERALYLLQKYGIAVTNAEWLAIRTSDGLYDESTKEYFVTHDINKNLKTNLPYIIHWSDIIACRAEGDDWKRMNQQDDKGTIE